MPADDRHGGAPAPGPVVRWPASVWVVLGLVALVFAAANLTPLDDSDTWWRVAAGELTIDRGQLLRTDPFSWTAAGEAWFSSGWATDVLLALVYRAASGVGLSLLAALAMAAFVLAVAVFARQLGAGPWSCVGGAAVAALLARPFMVPRPQALVLVLFPIAVVEADRALAGSRAALAALGLVFVMWANLHASVPLGLAVVALWALARAARVEPRVSPGRAALVVAVAIVASLVNPTGVTVLTRAFATRAVSAEIVEWQPLDLGDPGEMAAALVLVGALVSFAHPRCRRRLELFFPLLLLTVLSFDAIRNLPFAAVLGAAQLALAADRLELPELARRVRGRERLAVRLASVGLVVAAVLVASTWHDIGDPDRSEFPVDVVGSIPTGCRLLNEYTHGGFVIHERWPDVTVSQDGRNDLYGQARLDEQRDVLEASSSAAVEGFGATCVLVRPGRPLADSLASDDRWREVGRDAQAVLFVPAGAASSP